MSASLVLVAFLSTHSAQTGDVTIPVTNRQANFSGAAGVYRIAVQASPSSVEVEEPITLAVKIISLEPGPWPQPPQRDKLRILPASLNESFFVEPLPELDQFISSERAWEFTWKLMPKHEGISKIPALEFVYYHTGPAPDFKAAEGTMSIPIEVKPRPALWLAAPASARTQFQQLVQGPSLLTKSLSPAGRLFMLGWGAFLPPLLCFLGYFVWWRLFPDAAERMRRRRSRALKSALARLRKLGNSATPNQVRGVLTEYLRLRLAMPPGEPTPSEVKNALMSRGFGSEQACQVETILHSYDAAMFGPTAALRENNFLGSATRLMRSLEVELCSLPSR